MCSFNGSVSRRSPATEWEFPKSNAVPGVLGVFAEDPNEANAPVPKPKADDAALVGEATFVVAKGVMPLRGFVLLLKDSNRLAGWYAREPPSLLFSLVVPLELEMEFLLEL